MRLLKIIGLNLFLIIAGSVVAQDISKKQIHSLTEKIIETINDNYVIPELRNKIVAGLNKNIEDGKYTNIVTKSEFQQVLTDDLFELSNDKHLYLILDKGDAESKSSPKLQMMQQVPDANAFKDLLSYKILDGNIAYLDIPMFGPLTYLKEDLDNYLEKSLSADALIIDVRQCPGGSGETAAYLAGGFIAEPILLTSYFSKQGEEKAYSAKTRYGAANQTKDVFVLTSRRTGSAAEGFAFYLQQQNRVQVIGMQSAGAGRRNQFYPIDNEFSLSVSITTSITPNGKQFQGIGVTPDVITPAKNALNQAMIQAFLNLQKKYPDQISSYDALIQSVGKSKVRLQPGDITKIKKTVNGYIENFFENNTEEMFKYLHPDLAKRGMSKKHGEDQLFFQNMTKTELIGMLQKKKPLPKEEQRNSIEVLDIFYNTANVKLETGYPNMKWIEYILMARIDNEWKITDIIWDYEQKRKTSKRKK